MVARSSIKVDYGALALAYSKIIWLDSLLKELHHSLPHTSNLLCNNMSAKHFSINLIMHARLKHAELDRQFLHDQVNAAR